MKTERRQKRLKVIKIIPWRDVPITASGLQGEKPLANRSKQVREVGKIAP